VFAGETLEGVEIIHRDAGGHQARQSLNQFSAEGGGKFGDIFMTCVPLLRTYLNDIMMISL
jgi:hypothetical protein